jgi:hypothetical protein
MKRFSISDWNMTYNTMEQRISKPHPKCGLREESVFLSERVQLRVSIQYPGRDKLVEDTDDEWRKHGEDNVVQG